VVRTYVRSLETAAWQTLEERSDRSGEGRVRLTSVKIEAPGRPSGEIVTGESLRFTFALSTRVPGLDCAFGIYDASGNLIADFTSIESSPLDVVFDLQLAPEPHVVVCELDELLLLPGRYRIDVGLYLSGDLQDHVEGAAFFTVGPGAIRGRPVRGEATFGIVQIPHVWKFGDASARRSGTRVS
jgi:lipopolysaccharide transport system ATP-binding protein